MTTILLIAGREFRAYFATFSGYFILAGHLLVSGLLFNVYAVGSRAKFSQKVLEDFFFLASGMAMVTAILLSARLIAEERQNQTLVLLSTAPISEREIVLGKFFSALAFFSLTVVISLYLPALVFINGKVSVGHILGGYAGLLLLGAATISISMLASSWCSSQLTAGALAAVMVTLLLVAWMAAQVSDQPLKGILNYVAFHNLHFRAFSRGMFALRDVVYYLTLTVFFLECTVRSLEAWRWRE
ncbi:MAG: ABC transporter permease [bacterium]